ncbi:hypothetical protein Mevan_1224 [Methanococcus vannielii SB]|uniref:Uncharacterized protein n=1 Tax=Methanococcus vannielii (strain ATCC 35089 / DSM 1224 / JCM 13029 / OCM 148 / SB) TaxID=406327 RepID=A6URK0_METVS|nr:hypothetical protein [Methanococcus vannielii]ABR55122.1 hypothetical protein Mevan_1224 [Methanococcus vannielii SB]
MNLKNPYSNYLNTSMILLLFSSILFLTPLIFNIDGMDGGFAIYFVSIWLILSFVVLNIVFLHLKLKIQPALKNSVFIGKFIYDDKELKKLKSEKLADYYAKKYFSIGIWILLSIVGIFVGLFYSADIWYFIMMFGIGAVIFSIMWIASLIELKKSVPTEAWFFNNGIIYENYHIIFDGRINELKNAYIKEKNKLRYIIFEVEMPVNRGLSREIVKISVLIPKNEDDLDILKNYEKYLNNI